MNDGVWSKWWCSCYDRAGIVVQLALDWLMVKLLVLEPGHWDGVDFLVRKQAQVRWFLWMFTTAKLQDLVLHVDDGSH